jgi:hypothetical protein
MVESHLFINFNKDALVLQCEQFNDVAKKLVENSQVKEKL